MKSILDDVRAALEKPDGFTLDILLLNGNKLNVSIYNVCDDGFVVDLAPDGTLPCMPTYLPLSAIAHFNVEY